MKTDPENNNWTMNRQCNGVIVHENLPTELRARRLWHQLVNDMGWEIRCDATYQTAEQIKESLELDRFSQTDVVIISVHDLALFFFGGAEWLTNWLDVKSCRPRALFVLHDGKEDSQMVGFLRTICKFAGVSLFSQGRETGDDPAVSGLKHDYQPAEGLAFVS